ncbi:MAG: ankyrin repeat domain-containing protein, partial [Phycisphaerae bacterium]|nr:ankyrin repeat domain-containing protein [Phycisphaerae bacterium]
DAGTALEVRVLCELGADPNAVCAKRECGEDSCTHVELPLLFHAAVDAGDQNDAKTEALLRAGANPLAQDAEGHTPLMRAAAALCRDATDHGSRYQAFFEGLNELGLDARPMPPARDDFIAEVTPLLRTYVERFAREIPATGPSERDAERRSERIACVVSLCAYECWARHELRNAGKP